MSTSSAAAQLRERARAPDALERADIPWLHGLEANEKERALADLKVVKVEPGELLCRVGRPVTYWFGVIDGLLKTSNDTAQGIPITFTGLPPGGKPVNVIGIPSAVSLLVLSSPSMTPNQ